MRRTLALVALLLAAGVLLKLAGKSSDRAPTTDADRIGSGSGSATATTADSAAAEGLRRDEIRLLVKYSDPADRGLVKRALEKYGHNAIRIEANDGLRGLRLLETLDLEAIFLYERHPREFRTLRDALGNDESAAKVLTAWREYFGWKRADDTDRRILVNEIANLGTAPRRAAARYPNALPLLLTSPEETANLIESWSSDPEFLADALAILMFVDLEAGSSNLSRAIRVLDGEGRLAVEAFRVRGMEGFALAALYAPVVRAVGDALPLNDLLALLRVNTDGVDRLLVGKSPEWVGSLVRRVAWEGLAPKAGDSPHALRMLAEYGDLGFEALRNAGGDAADVAYETYGDPAGRRRAVEALAAHGEMALPILEKYAADDDFRAILKEYGPAVIPPIARADPAPEVLAILRAKEETTFTEKLAREVMAWSRDSGQGVIARIKRDGPARAAEAHDEELRYYMFLPLYDVARLARVLGSGYAPTGAELTWAVVDGAFVVMDAVAIAGLRPEGAAAAQAARANLKIAVRTAAGDAGSGVERVSANAAKRAGLGPGTPIAADEAARRAARWWSVRRAGGAFAVLRRKPEVLQTLTLAQLGDLARPLAAKIGVRVSNFAPARFWTEGAERVVAVAAERGPKYVAAQAAQAGVGILAVTKMEEHLRGRGGGGGPGPAPAPGRAARDENRARTETGIGIGIGIETETGNGAETETRSEPDPRPAARGAAISPDFRFSDSAE